MSRTRFGPGSLWSRGPSSGCIFAVLLTGCKPFPHWGPGLYSGDARPERAGGVPTAGPEDSVITADVAPTNATRTLEDPLAEALRIVGVAQSRGLLVRLMGGMAVRAHVPDWTHRTRRREVDLDFATRSKDRAAVCKLLEAEGYSPDKRHNAMFEIGRAHV